jgi:alpha-N-acetylgalactosaminidase
MRFLLVLASGALGVGVVAVNARNNLSRTPPMGWMSWEIFRCNIDCQKDPANCISERLYKEQADAIVSQGFLSAGYNAIHMDDCWERKVPPRDPTTNKLVGDPVRFPGGMKALGDYYHNKGVKYALYTAESPHTCGGYPASANHEMLDAQTFADW